MASEVEGADLNSVVARLDVEGALLDAEDVGNEDAVEVDVANEGGAEAPKPSSSMEVEGAAEAAEEPAKGARNGSAKRVPFRRRLGRGPGRANGPPTPNGKPTLTIRARGKVLEMDGHFVWISNLPYDTTWKELKDVIRKKVGGIRRCEIAEDDNGKSLGFGVASFASEEFAKKCIEQMKDFDLKTRKLAARELTKNDELRLARLAKRAPHATTASAAAHGAREAKFAPRRSAPYPSRSPAQFGRPPSLLGSLGAFAASSQSPFGSSFGVSPFGAPPVASLSAEYGAPSGAGGGAPAPLERVLAALRQERVLSETQLADLGVSPSALKSLGVDFDRYLTNQVFVSNLAYTVNYHDVRRALSAAGRVERVKLPTTGTGDEERHSGYGIVTFENIYDAIQAIQMFNMKMLFDRTVKVRTYVPDELGYFSRPRGTSEPVPSRASAFERLPRPPAMGELVGSSTGPVLPYASVAPAAPNSPWPSSSAPAPMREAHEQWGGFSRGAPAAPFRAPAVGPSMGGNKAIAAADETAAIIVKNLPGTYDETEVQRTFRPIASAVEVELLRDSMGRSMGVARVRFASPADAIRVIRMMDGARIENAVLNIQQE